MNRTRILAILTLLAAGSLPAQDLDRSGRELARTQSLRDSVAIAAAGNTIRTGGWDYAADFDASGLRFVPALGASAPVEQWLRMRPMALLRGNDVLLAFDAMTPAAPAQVGNAVEYARAAGITERYEVTSRGLQLSWRFESPLRGSGDLVVRYHVDSNMAAASPAEAGGIGFRLEGIGGVDIGTVTGIDARGVEARGGIRRDGNVLELSLPARLVDHAAYPLVLDPLIGTQFAVQTEAWNDSKPDVAYDASNDVYLVAFRRVFSATSMAVRAQRIASSGALVGGFLLLASGAQVFEPSVANVSDTDSFVVAWSQAPSILEPADVLCASVSAATGAISAPVVVAGDPTLEETEPDVSGEGLSGPHVLVAYRVRNAGIRLAYLTQLAAAPAGPVLATTTTVTNAVRAAAPALSKSPQGTSARVLVWQDLSSSIGRIRARAVSPTGTLLGAELSVAQATVLGTIPIAQPGIPDVDGDGQRFLVAYDFDQILSTEGNRDVYCRALTWDGTSLALQGASSTPLGQNNNDQFEPVVAWCRYKFLVAFTDQFLQGTNNYDVRAFELDASCRTCGTPNLLSGLNTSLTRNIEFQPAVASKASGGSPLDDALLVFCEADDAPPFEGSLVGHGYSALGNGGVVTVVGSECGTGGIIESNGTPFAVGNPGFEIRLRSAPAGAIPFLLLGFPGGELTCGTCIYTNAVSTTFVLPSGGAIAYAYDLPCSATAFVGIQVQAQWALLNTASSRCPLVSGLSFSPRLRLTLGF